ncbi:MAG: YraN family protein, partial [bacterium]|nr:YraN family protein [bacterium]
MNTRELGNLGEDLAVNLLQSKGYKILCRNFHSKLGEIDIVAQDCNVLVFVEVKTRWSKEFGLPEEAITPRKIRLIIKTGQYYQLLNPKTPEALRIDAVLAELDT